MVQKTVRFYEESSEDTKALVKLKEYRKYGFSSSREMIIAAINSFEQRKNNEAVIGGLVIEELAEAIAKRINVNVTTVASENVVEEKEEKYDDNNSKEDNFSKAMEFINSL